MLTATRTPGSLSGCPGTGCHPCTRRRGTLPLRSLCPHPDQRSSGPAASTRPCSPHHQHLAVRRRNCGSECSTRPGHQPHCLAGPCPLHAGRRSGTCSAPLSGPRFAECRHHPTLGIPRRGPGTLPTLTARTACSKSLGTRAARLPFPHHPLKLGHPPKKTAAPLPRTGQSGTVPATSSAPGLKRTRAPTPPAHAPRRTGAPGRRFPNPLSCAATFGPASAKGPRTFPANPASPWPSQLWPAAPAPRG